MFLPDTSIRRPVLATVVTIGIVLGGWLGFRALAVRELPDIEYPIVAVTTVLPGASPEVVETEVTEVLEEEINTVEGIKTLTSVSAENTSQITAEFVLSRDVDLALQDVRAKVARVRGQLPDDVEEPVVQKQDPAASPIVWLSVQNPQLPVTAVNDYADNVIKQRLQTLDGVGSVILGGEQRFAVRINLDPQRMASLGVVVGDVQRALQTRNVELPSGRVEAESREFTVRTQGEFTTPEAFNDLIVVWRDGAPVRLSDIGRAVPGVENRRTLARFNGTRTVGVGVVKQSDANTVAVAEGVLDEMERLREELPPGYAIEVAVNDAEFIERSVAEVEETILIALGLVVLVILLFLRNWRATLIPALAIPVSLVGTFAALWLLGFSINTLTLLALVLAVGIVVDDAIVVVENVYRHIEEEGENPREAARRGAGEIAFAVLAISLTLVVVFMPIAFISGIVGRLFREFGLTVAVSVAISAFVALTLTPMLSSRFLKAPDEDAEPNALFRWAEGALAWISARYERALDAVLDRPGWTVAVAVASLAGSLWIAGLLGQEFVPPEDRGQFLVTVQAPEGATLAYTDGYQKQIEEILLDTEGVRSFFSAIGLAVGGPASVTQGILFVRLDDDRERDQFAVMDEVRAEVSRLAGVDVYLIAPSSLNPGGFQQPLQYVLQADDLQELDRVATRLEGEARSMPGVVGASTDVELDKPQLDLSVDRARAASLGVDVAQIATTLQILLAGRDLSEFTEQAERYEVVVQLEDSLRASPDDLRSIYVRGEGGRMVQLASVVDLTETVGPNQVSHYNRLRSITVSASPQGIPLGQALSQLERAADEIVPADFDTAVAGQTQDFQESFASLFFALGMAVVAVYLILAGQFESFVHPFTIMLALPLALVGAVATLWVFDMTLNIYSFIGIIMLVGLVTKNSILLVDFATQARGEGASPREAALRAGAVRLRPILMTSVSIIFGVLPIALALGAGAESRRPLGAVVVGGMITSTVLTLFVVPVFYLLIDRGLVWLREHGPGWLGGATATAGLVLALCVPGVAGAMPLPRADAAAPAPQQTAAAASLGGEAAPASDTAALSLEAAVERAVARNETVLEARAEQARAEGQVVEVRARSLPGITLDMGYTRNFQTPVIFFNNDEGTQQVTVGNPNEYVVGLRMEQPILDFSLGPARAAARLARRASAAQVEAARVEVTLQTRMAYYQVLLDRALVRVQEQALAQARDRLAQVEAFREAGTASEFDLLTARVEVDNLRPGLLEARNDLELDRDRLKRTIDLPLETPLQLTDTLADAASPPRLDAVVDEALRSRPELQGQQTRVRLQEENLASEDLSYLPSLNLTAALERRVSSDEFAPPQRDFAQAASAGVSFSLPLFDGRARAGRIQQAEAALRGERIRLRRTREAIRLEVEQAHQTLRTAAERIAASRANVRRAERALEIAQTRFANGLSTQVELNDAELAVTRARSNFVQARYDWNVARARLDAAVGRREAP